MASPFSLTVVGEHEESIPLKKNAGEKEGEVEKDVHNKSQPNTQLLSQSQSVESSGDESDNSFGTAPEDISPEEEDENEQAVPMADELNKTSPYGRAGQFEKGEVWARSRDANVHVSGGGGEDEEGGYAGDARKERGEGRGTGSEEVQGGKGIPKTELEYLRSLSIEEREAWFVRISKVKVGLLGKMGRKAKSKTQNSSQSSQIASKSESKPTSSSNPASQKEDKDKDKDQRHRYGFRSSFDLDLDKNQEHLCRRCGSQFFGALGGYIHPSLLSASAYSFPFPYLYAYAHTMSAGEKNAKKKEAEVEVEEEAGEDRDADAGGHWARWHRTSHRSLQPQPYLYHATAQDLHSYPLHDSYLPPYPSPTHPLQYSHQYPYPYPHAHQIPYQWTRPWNPWDPWRRMQESSSLFEHRSATSGGPMAAIVLESGLSALDELKLLKQQVQDVARVCKAVADGDLSQKITVPVQGAMMVKFKEVINTMVDNLNIFAKEVTRVAHEVGTEGRLGGQALVSDVEGTWRELTTVVNKLAANLTNQVRSIAQVTKSVALGDLSKQIQVDARGEILDLKNTVNGMVVRLRALAAESCRNGSDSSDGSITVLMTWSTGKLGGQARVPDVEGVWYELVKNVNRMCASLTDQVRSIAIVTTAVAKGDLTQKIEIRFEGEMATLKTTVNSMVDQLGAFASEVTRVALEVGTQGILGGQARVEGVQGTWADLTRNVNKMASNLTNQVRSISEVTKAVAQGNLSMFVEVDVQGEMLDLKETINSMVVQLSTLASEVTCISLEVGTEGILGGQAFVPDVEGEWKVLTDNVNLMAMNLTNQVRSIAEVTKAVASGDLSKKIQVDVQGEILELKDTVNSMVDQLGAFASEVTRVALEVGTEGILGGQARVEGVQGTWADLTRNVNKMASNLTNQVRSISEVTKAVAQGNLSMFVEVDVQGEMLDLKETINSMVVQLSTLASEVTRVSLEVGTEGILGGQAYVPYVEGEWKVLTDNVNLMAMNLTFQVGGRSRVRSIAMVTTAVAKGDLTQKIEIQVEGEMATLKATVNSMVDQLGAFASEVTRVALEVGTEGILGGQARVEGVQGVWADLTRNVNKMASNLTNQVRSISEVTKAVAQGNLSKFVEVDVQGEMLDLKETINSMVVQLSTLASEVTRVSLEVGTEGILGGQAFVPDVEGEWKVLTDNVNLMAMNLTNQVGGLFKDMGLCLIRSIAEVTKAVASGDLSKKIQVNVRGEILELKESVNEMTESLSVFADEVTRVAREVGTEGKLGAQARVDNVAGTWKALTDNVNAMANNLTLQVRTIAIAATAVARGDLTQKIGGLSVSGEMLNLVNTINDMIDQLSIFAVEVKKVAHEVGTEGKLGVQAEVGNVQGIWQEITLSVNTMAGNLTTQVRAFAQISAAAMDGDLTGFITVGGLFKDMGLCLIRSIAEVTKAVASGDLSKKIQVNVRGEILELKESVNEMTESLSVFADEVTRVAREVGTEGKLGAQARVDNVAGTWKALTDNVNAMANNLTLQVRTIAIAATAVARGDLTQKIGGLSVSGEMLNLVNTINDMIDQLSIFAVEVKKVAHEVGTEGKLGVQAEVGNVQGIWQEITLSVNTMAGNLTTQVRAFAQISAAAMDGDLTGFITVEASSEMDSLKIQINNMVSNLRDLIQKNTAAKEVAELANRSTSKF
ncbi:hypothetical protein GYMLUDRAFT_239314 [Collybiopsis luxurians FD-317 M1]|nr:hypothetical protein GYMLUDRAFT_239314 [Collybiopsis luxurians FD-317 M1]